MTCPRCGHPDCTDPDSKGCSDNCIMRHNIERIKLQIKNKKLISELEQKIEGLQASARFWQDKCGRISEELVACQSITRKKEPVMLVSFVNPLAEEVTDRQPQ